ncbi:MAG: acetyl-CoA carboxylase biotin carboxyl carrier protein [Rhodocyclales bacterium]|nr:acetyl-CoA carboxylase biotin carboxyl carrier protein [Rhodocyclales bacterium]
MSNTAFSYQDLLQIVDLIKTSAQFNEFHLKVGDIELDIRRGESAARPAPALPTLPAALAPAASIPTPATPAAPPPPAAVAEPHRGAALAYPAGSVLVKSPMVGTYYRAPEPGAHPFVEVGARVTAQSIVGIVEVMKLMNSIPAGQAGVVTHLLVEDGEPVQYGQVLVVIEPGTA